MITPGIYQHYNGKRYEVLGVGRHSETLEELVLYKALYDDPEFGKGALWARPKEEFEELVDKEGKSIPRFSRIE